MRQSAIWVRDSAEGGGRWAEVRGVGHGGCVGRALPTLALTRTSGSSEGRCGVEVRGECVGGVVRAVEERQSVRGGADVGPRGVGLQARVLQARRVAD